MLKVFKIFSSLQGESTFQGFPCTFIRLGGCNLRCSWCDTPETWEISSGHPMTTKEILMNINTYKNSLVEITGGEPLLQPEVFTLIDALISENYTTLIETNGSMLIKNVHPKAIVIIDIKPPSSKEEKSNNYNNLNYLLPGDEIKFPISNKEDFNFALDIISSFLSSFDFSLENAYLRRPKGDNRAEIRNSLKDSVPISVLFSPVEPYLEPKELGEWLLNANLSGVRMQLQLHKVLGLD